MQGGRLVLIDMGGPNGTFVNKQKLAANTPHPVSNGDEIRLGRLTLNYYSN
jgi:pSer/pThr/pTyr-binding forkhead associated (FHA) protein